MAAASGSESNPSYLTPVELSAAYCAAALTEAFIGISKATSFVLGIVSDLRSWDTLYTGACWEKKKTGLYQYIKMCENIESFSWH